MTPAGGPPRRSMAGGVSIGGVLYITLPALTIVLAAVSALGVAAMYQARQSYEDALARTYRAEVAVREARAAATVELALGSIGTSTSSIRRDAAAQRRRIEAAARAAVEGDAASERLVARQLAAQRRALVASRRGAGSGDELEGELRDADAAATAAVKRQRRLARRSRDAARVSSRDALVRSGVAGGLALVAALSLIWLLVRGMHEPLAGIVRASERLADDDLEARVDPRGPTEIRRLGDAFNAMAEQLQTRQVQLQSALQGAERANQAKMEFLSRVSHELRTPLNAILGFSQLLQMDDLTERQQESVDHVLRAGRHLLALVDGVLELSRVESDQPRMTLTPVDVGELVGEVVAGNRELAASRGVSLSIELPEGRPVIARADPGAVRQVLLHLVVNGIKYNREHGHLRITAGEDERRVWVTFADDGPGIPSDQLGKIFVPFERLAAEEAGIDGMGLGLALSQRLAGDMDGTIDVTSEVGRGTTFTLALPAHARAQTTGGLSDRKSG